MMQDGTDDVDVCGEDKRIDTYAKVPSQVPKLSSLCFPTIQNLHLHSIDLSTPLPVTHLGAEPCTPLPVTHYSSDTSRASQYMGSQTLIHRMRSRQFKCRKEIFYKMGQKSHWRDQKKLLTAIQTCQISQVSEMLELGADPNVCDQKKRTPLHIAASQGHNHLVTILLSKRADPNCKDIQGNTPLHLAVCRGDLATVKLLIENGSNIFMPDNSGRTPLSLVCNRLGGLRRSKSSCTQAFKTEFVLMSELLCSPATRHINTTDPFVSSIDDLCNQMQTVSTREKADKITDAAMQQMSKAVSDISLSKISLL